METSPEQLTERGIERGQWSAQWTEWPKMADHLLPLPVFGEEVWEDLLLDHMPTSRVAEEVLVEEDPHLIFHQEGR